MRIAYEGDGGARLRISEIFGGHNPQIWHDKAKDTTRP
jgi:hypothetical protein